MERTGIVIVIFLALLSGIIALQIFLSRRERVWPGLVLPGIAFLWGLLYPLSMTAPSGGADGGFLVQLLLVWLLGNIPTIVLLAIYFGCREKNRRRRQLEKMNIQDLD